MLKILQARLQQYVNRELPDIQAGFRKGRGIRDQIVNIHWITEKAREFQKNICVMKILFVQSFPSPVATAEFSKFAAILSAALSQHHLSGFEIPLEFHHLH